MLLGIALTAGAIFVLYIGAVALRAWRYHRAEQEFIRSLERR